MSQLLDNLEDLTIKNDLIFKNNNVRFENLDEIECDDNDSIENDSPKKYDDDFIEPLLDPKNERFTVFPIEYPTIWKLYKKQQDANWRAEEIDFTKDYDDFMKLDPNEQWCIKRILAFFAASDGIVNFGIKERFLREIKIMEAQIAYGFQLMMESVHGEVYSLMLENIIRDPLERDQLFNAIQTIDSIKMMSDWAMKWIRSDKSFAHRVIANAAVEGIFFSGAFAIIFWLKKYRSHGKNIMDGLIKSNQLISRDEGLHCDYGCELYSLLVKKLDAETVYELIDEAVSISKMFSTDSIKCELIGMNKQLMSEYIEYVADRLLVQLGYEKKYNQINPFDFMDSISLPHKINFFESRPTEYQLAFNQQNLARRKLVILDDF